MNETVMKCKVLAINQQGNVTLEIRALNVAPMVVVLGVGASFQYCANIVDAEITVLDAAKAALEKARRA